MRLLNLAAQGGYLVPQADLRKRFKSLTLQIAACFKVNANSGKNWVVCVNQRCKLMRFMTRRGELQVEGNIKLREGTYRYLVTNRAKNRCYRLTKNESTFYQSNLLGWLELTNIQVYLVLGPVDMRKRYNSLALYLRDEYPLTSREYEPHLLPPHSNAV